MIIDINKIFFVSRRINVTFNYILTFIIIVINIIDIDDTNVINT